MADPPVSTHSMAAEGPVAAPSPGLVAAMDGIAEAMDRQFDLLLPVPEDPRRRLFEAMRHATIGGGKRLRPLLVTASCALFHVDTEAALRVATAIECIHVCLGL